MNENILYKFAKDLNRLYAKIQVKKIEDCFLKVAQAFDIEVEQWLLKAVQRDIKSTLQEPKVFDTLIMIARLKKSGTSQNDLVKLFINDEKFRSFLPIIISLRNISSSQEFAILSPYKSILDSTQNMTIHIGNSEDAAVEHDILTLDSAFRDEINRKMNKVYEDGKPSGSKRKITKREKINLLLGYLSKRFAEEISISYESLGVLDPIGFSENPNVLKDPAQVLEKMFPTYPSENVNWMIKQANEIVKDVIKFADPQYYDFAYNYIKNKVMLSGAKINQKQYNEFIYQAKLNFSNFSEDFSEETNSIEIDPSAWEFSHVFILLTFVLYILGTKIN